MGSVFLFVKMKYRLCCLLVGYLVISFCKQIDAQNLPEHLRQRAFRYLLKGEITQLKVWKDSFLLLGKTKITADTLTLVERHYQKIFENYLQKKAFLKLNTFLGRKPLSGLKIALDPGHFAGDSVTARLEGKYIEMNLPDSTQIFFWESYLAWATAKLLQEKLQQYGANVMLTRSQPNYTAFEKTFQQHYQEYLENFRQQNSSKKRKKVKPLNEKQFFRLFFRKQELQERVRKINEFAPDLTLIIHYNVDEQNSPWKKPVSQNFAMAFVAGAFEWQDLDKNSTEDFLRLLTSKDIELSIYFSEKILQAHQIVAGVPPVPVKNNQKFLQEKCLFTGKQGVYARNLLLCKSVKGIVCYGESLLQDSDQEIKRLNEKTLQVGNIWVSSRVKDIAEAYFQGIMNFLKEL